MVRSMSISRPSMKLQSCGLSIRRFKTFAAELPAFLTLIITLAASVWFVQPEVAAQTKPSAGKPAPAKVLPGKSAPAQSAWTLMIYEDADNSLETPQLANVQEMLQVGSTDKVQIVMLCD